MADMACISSLQQKQRSYQQRPPESRLGVKDWIQRKRFCPKAKKQFSFLVKAIASQDPIKYQWPSPEKTMAADDQHPVNEFGFLNA